MTNGAQQLCNDHPAAEGVVAEVMDRLGREEEPDVSQGRRRAIDEVGEPGVLSSATNRSHSRFSQPRSRTSRMSTSRSTYVHSICCTQRGEQLVERRLMRRRVLEPGEEIERLVLREIPTVVESSRQLGKILQPDLGVPGLLLEDALTFVLCEAPPGRVLSYRDQCGAACVGVPDSLLPGGDLAAFRLADDIPLVACHSTQYPAHV